MWEGVKWIMVLVATMLILYQGWWSDDWEIRLGSLAGTFWCTWV